MLIKESVLRDIIRQEIIKEQQIAEAINKKSIISAALAFLLNSVNVANSFALPNLDDFSNKSGPAQTQYENPYQDPEIIQAIKDLEIGEKVVGLLGTTISQIGQEDVEAPITKKVAIKTADKEVKKAVEKVNNETAMVGNVFKDLQGLNATGINDIKNKLKQKDIQKKSNYPAKLAQSAALISYMVNLGVLMTTNAMEKNKLPELEERLKTYTNYIVKKITSEKNTAFTSTQDIYNYFKKLGMVP